MRILITNDDGINAPGLKAAEAIAAELAGPDGEVWVVAPAWEQSAVSHCVSYVRPMRMEQWEEHRFIVEGSPADCVLAALGDIMEATPPDLVLSGVNRGHNVAEDTIYSGTIGGAMEGALHGIRSIALSQYYGPGNTRLPDTFEAARKWAVPICRALLDRANWEDTGYQVFYNVNFPACPAAEVLGVRATFQGKRPSPTFKVQPAPAPNGRNYYWLTHGAKGNIGAEDGSDAREVHRGYCTVTPLRPDMTARDQAAHLAGVVDGL
ncbi:5'/3'-nucleotidase SurE [Halovulum dunhuangense]|uniref:5'-nucleotidase SurE n=1 Tax=Halovulum dunhuangense TaxID=1505036 RepID=A0A849L6I4_9RHOB|nr:5'/3'-nucleotidase SurE [Halovulum dunhuangense]NNU81863.1 5'/3'-nucleotidase SurE [Halovulum dunhuangense]